MGAAAAGGVWAGDVCIPRSRSTGDERETGTRIICTLIAAERPKLFANFVSHFQSMVDSFR